MLTLLLVWTVALGSLTIFGAGMIFPELSRKNDLIWVGVGLFYALILWVNAGNLNGGLLLGQTAGISLTVWLGWQTLTQRRELTPLDKKTPVPGWLQKIVDVVTPLWQKAYGLVAGQLGLDGAEEGAASGDSDNASSAFKSKALGLLDKLNPQSSETSTQESSTEDNEVSDDEPESETSEAEAEAVAVEEVTDQDSEDTSISEASPSSPSESSETPEQPPEENNQPSVNVIEEPVQETSVVEEPMEGAISGGSVETPDESHDDNVASAEPLSETAEDVSHAQVEVQDPQETVETVDQDHTPEDPAPVVDSSDTAVSESEEASPVVADDQPDSSEPDSSAEVTVEASSEPIEAPSEPIEAPSETEESDDAIAEDHVEEMTEEPPQEDSNWPPEESMD